MNFREKFFWTKEPLTKESLFWILTAIQTVALIAANMAVSVVFRLPGAAFTLAGINFETGYTGALFVFPLTCVTDDLVTELYGWKNNKSMWFSLACMFALTLFLRLLGDESLPNLWPACAASLMAFAAGSWINSAVLIVLKKRFQDKPPLPRFLLSTAVGQLADTAVFSAAAVATGLFADWRLGLELFPVEYSAKILYEAICYPLIMKRLLRRFSSLEN